MAESALSSKVETTWRVLILGSFALAARLSWSAMESAEVQRDRMIQSLDLLREAVHGINTRLTLVEDKAGRHELLLAPKKPDG